MLATLLTPEKATITNLLCTSGQQHQDWSADYRLYSQDRIDQEQLFNPILQEILAHLPEPSTSTLLALLSTSALLRRKRG